MITITLKCVSCGKTRDFSGANVDGILRAIDGSGWRDFPPVPSAMCPDCDAQMADNYRGEK